MNKYRVKLRVSGKAIVYVEADDDVEAIERAEEEIGLADIDSLKMEEAQEVCLVPQIRRIA